MSELQQQKAKPGTTPARQELEKTFILKAQKGFDALALVKSTEAD